MTGILGCINGRIVPPPILVQLHNQTISKSGRTATAGYTIASTGTVQNQASTVLEAWLLTGGVAGNYEVRATPTIGTLDTGTTGTWLSCGTSTSWTIGNDNLDNSTITAVFLVEIRLASTGVVQASATITLNATSNALGGG